MTPLHGDHGGRWARQFAREHQLAVLTAAKAEVGSKDENSTWRFRSDTCCWATGSSTEGPLI